MQFRNPHTFGPLKSAFFTEAREREASNASDWGRGSFTNVIPTVYVRPIRLAGGKEENKTDDAKLSAFYTWDNQ